MVVCPEGGACSRADSRVDFGVCQRMDSVVLPFGWGYFQAKLVELAWLAGLASRPPLLAHSLGLTSGILSYGSKNVLVCNFSKMST